MAGQIIEMMRDCIPEELRDIVVGIIIALKINNMDYSDKHAPGDSPQEHDAGFMVYCKLFSDQVTNHLCAIRRQELNSRGVFSCNGCLATHNGSDEGHS